TLSALALTGMTLGVQLAHAAPPVAANDSRTLMVNGTITINVLANDFDDDSDPLSLVSTGSPANGSISLNSDSSIRYTPNRGYIGADSFTYVISDSNGETASATVTI